MKVHEENQLHFMWQPSTYGQTDRSSHSFTQPYKYSVIDSIFTLSYCILKIIGFITLKELGPSDRAVLLWGVYRETEGPGHRVCCLQLCWALSAPCRRGRPDLSPSCPIVCAYYQHCVVHCDQSGGRAVTPHWGGKCNSLAVQLLCIRLLAILSCFRGENF